MSTPERPIGVFRAVATRDGNALSRDGQDFYRINHVFDDPRDGPIFEVQFQDGLWMLAATEDLDLAPSTDVARFVKRRRTSTSPPSHPRG